MSDVLGIMGPFQALLFLTRSAPVFSFSWDCSRLPAHMLDLPTLLYDIKRRPPTLQGPARRSYDKVASGRPISYTRNFTLCNMVFRVSGDMGIIICEHDLIDYVDLQQF